MALHEYCSAEGSVGIKRAEKDEVEGMLSDSGRMPFAFPESGKNGC